jgi:hypothetical protein
MNTQAILPQSVKAPKDFRGAYCRKYRCLPERFVQSVFWQCIPSEVMPIAQVVHTLAPSAFAQDFELIRMLAKASSPADITSGIESRRYQNQDAGLLRGALKVRISHQRLISLANDLLEGHSHN